MVLDIKNFLLVLLYMISIDAIWLKFIVGKVFVEHAKTVFREDGVLLWSAAIVYVLMTLGLMIFVKPYIERHQSMLPIFLYGGVFGFIIYGVFDFTNHAILKQWPLNLIVLDLVWGAFLLGSSSLVLKKIIA
ncbi:MAG TPA: DUF2177 family protein [Oligoflexia bacterium]|nr:DUF2177 family protein [Oligoflexia bacterium]HMR24644.1 DUF2177 family protein [Oligoflexia bacterium]